jgi:hypothetical protein
MTEGEDVRYTVQPYAWHRVALCEIGDCSPDSNCESAPSDCALNIANQQFAWPLQQ